MQFLDNIVAAMSASYSPAQTMLAVKFLIPFVVIGLIVLGILMAFNSTKGAIERRRERGGEQP